MNVKDIVALLRDGEKGIGEWNVGRRRLANIPNLESVNLRNTVLRNADLSYLTLSNASITDADLTNANLKYGIFHNVDLRGSCLRGADLSSAKLDGADLSQADLRAAILVGANLIGARLIETHCEGADLRACDLASAILKDTDLSSANLRNADFRNAYLGPVSLKNAALHNAVFSSTVIACNLTGVSGLDQIRHHGWSEISTNTILSAQSEIPDVFLRGCGLRDEEIELFRSQAEVPIQFYSCFISHNHRDKPFARRLHDQLQARGIRCWLDERELLPGDRIIDVVNQAIRVHDKVLLCCSRDSLDSTWVDDEVSAAVAKERMERRDVLIPLNLDGHLFVWDGAHCVRIRERLAADFTGWQTDNAKFEEQFERVVRALQAKT